MLIHELLESDAERAPDKEAIVLRDRRVNYGEYLESVNRAAANLLKLGVRRRDKVALYIGNRPEYVFCYIATVSIGAAAVPVSTRFAANEAQFVVENSDSSLMIASPGALGLDFLEIVNKIKPDCPLLKTIVVLGEPAEVERVPGALPGDAVFGEVSEADMQALAKARAVVDEDDTAFLCYTSGSTGIPKAAELTHKNIVSYSEGQLDAADIGPDARLLLDIPVNHVGGNVMGIISMLQAGGTLVMLDQFIPQDVLETIQREKITVLGQVAAQYIMLMMVPDFDSYDLSSVEKAVVSAAPTPKEVFTQVKEKFGIYLTNGFGLSEVSGAVTFNRVDEDPFERLSTSIGKANKGIEVGILDPAGKPAAGGRGGRDMHQGRRGDEGLLQDARGDRAGDDRRRLFQDRRYGPHGRGRLRLYPRPQEGDVHPRRRERLPSRGRGGAHPSPGRHVRGGDRSARQADGRGRESLHRADARHRAPHRGRDKEVVRREAREVQGARGTWNSATPCRLRLSARS